MNAPQGRLTYGPFIGQLQANYTRTRGIAPNLISMTIPPPTIVPLPYRADAIFSYNGQSVTLRDCCVEDVLSSRSGGPLVWQVTIADRRWMWGMGMISGEYNIRAANDILPENKKTPQELATILLKAMDETGYDVSELPNDTFPYVLWDVSNPARELSDLCDKLGCRVALLWNDRVKIVKEGVGSALPVDRLMYSDVAFDPKPLPKNLYVLSAASKWQVDLDTEAVGEDTDGTIKPIAELSYNPGNDFLLEEPITFENLTGEAKKLALKTVWRYYRIKPNVFQLRLPPATDPVDASDPFANLLNDPKQILPVIPWQVEQEYADSEKRFKAAIVYGKFEDQNGGNQDNITAAAWAAAPDPLEVATDGTTPLIYPGSFEIDTKASIVKFADPVVSLGDVPGERAGYAAAELVLRCSVNFYEKDTRAKYRRYRKVVIDPTSPAPDAFIPKNDIPHMQYQDFDTKEWISPGEDTDESLIYYAEEESRNYLSQVAGVAKYHGFYAKDVDGTIREVTFQIDGNGKATTSMSLNTEQSLTRPTYAEFRKGEQINKLLEQIKTTEDLIGVKFDDEIWRRPNP